MKLLGIAIGTTALGIGLTPGFQSKSSEVTYAQHIEPIIREKCAPCHYKNGPAPFDLTTYESLTSRPELIRTEMLSHNMPPIWVHSDFAPLSRVSQTTDQQLVDLQKWLDSGMAKGVLKPAIPKVQPLLRPTFSASMGNQKWVKAESVPYWTVESVSIPASVKNLRSFKLIPTTPRAIRSATLAIVPEATKLPKETVGSLDLPAQQLVGVWSPGYNDWHLPSGYYRAIPKGSRLVVQVQYRPTGKMEKAGFRVHFYGTRSAKDVQPTWISLQKKPLLIPAGKSVGITLEKTFDQPTKLLTIFPEARFYAGRVSILLERKGKPERVLYENLRWDPYWIGNYSPSVPIAIQKGDRLKATFYYNNDDKCRANEGKNQILDIKDGAGATDEICRLHLLVSPATA